MNGRARPFAALRRGALRATRLFCNARFLARFARYAAFCIARLLARFARYAAFCIARFLARCLRSDLLLLRSGLSLVSLLALKPLGCRVETCLPRDT